MALGATRRDLTRLVLQQSLSMIAVGVALGVAVAWGAGRVMARVVEGARPAEPATLIVMTAVLVPAALLASAVPARRAGRVDALQALRKE